MTTVSTATKTAAGVLLALTQQATAVVTVGSAIDVSTKFNAKVFVKVGRTTSTALANEIKFRLEASSQASGNDEWVPVYEWTTATCKTAATTTTLNGATTAGNATSLLTSGTGFNAGALSYFRETGTPGNSEWSRVKSLSTNTVTFEEAQTRNHSNSIAVTTLSEYFAIDIDVSAFTRLRLVVDTATAATTTTADVIAWITTLDSVTNT